MLDDEATLSRILGKYLKKVNKTENIPMDADLKEMGLDSMSAINLLLEIETQFEVNFPDTMLNSAVFRSGNTLRDAIRILKKT